MKKVEMTNEEFLSKVGMHFNVRSYEDGVELETWTEGGVNMFIYLRKGDTSYEQQYSNYIENFDIDEEVLTHWQDESYRSEFTLVRAVEDFKTFINWLDELVEECVEVVMQDCESVTDFLATQKEDYLLECFDELEVFRAGGVLVSDSKIRELNQHYNQGDSKMLFSLGQLVYREIAIRHFKG